MGQLETIQYFDTNKDKRLTWSSPLFNNGKWGASKGKAATPEDQKELSMNCEMKSDV
jgi:hypothetical protein